MKKLLASVAVLTLSFVGVGAANATMSMRKDAVDYWHGAYGWSVLAFPTEDKCEMATSYQDGTTFGIDIFVTAQKITLFLGNDRWNSHFKDGAPYDVIVTDNQTHEQSSLHAEGYAPGSIVFRDMKPNILDIIASVNGSVTFSYDGHNFARGLFMSGAGAAIEQGIDCAKNLKDLKAEAGNNSTSSNDTW
jgi:hypothetical protein